MSSRTWPPRSTPATFSGGTEWVLRDSLIDLGRVGYETGYAKGANTESMGIGDRGAINADGFTKAQASNFLISGNSDAKTFGSA